MVKRYVIGFFAALVLIPVIFYLNFGRVDGFGWGLTIFVAVLSLMFGIGYAFKDKTEVHTDVPLSDHWTQRIGAFWLMACVFGPFLGWLVTSLIPITLSSWFWVYGLRVVLACLLPFITALPLLRYVRGPSIKIALVILIGITLLAMLSAAYPLMDLLNGVQFTADGGVYLVYTRVNFLGP